MDKVAKAVARGYRQRVASINALVTTNHCFQLCLCLAHLKVLQSAHCEMQHGICLPLLFQVHNLQSLKQLFLALEISLKGVAQQRLSETTGTGKKDIFIFIDKVKHYVCLVNIH